MNILRFLRRPKQKSIIRVRSPEMADIAVVRKARHDAELVPLLSHRNGYVREAAALRAGELLLPPILSHLMPRINDWVPEVRRAARVAVDAYVLADRFDDILSALPYVYWLKKCCRTDHAPFIEYIEKFLAGHRRAAEIPAMLIKRYGIHARSLFDLSWKYNLAPRSDLIRCGLFSRDIPTLRSCCRAIEQLPDAERVAFGRQLLQARTGWLRHEGLKIISELDLPAAAKTAKSYLLAEYTPLRELAEKLAGQSPEALSLLRQETLRNARGRNAVILTAIRLSGKLKDKNCEMLLEGFLKHENPAFRGGALLALARISPGGFDAIIFDFLHDEAPAVSRGASQAFLESGLSMTPDEWKTCIRKTHTKPHCQRLITLARKINKWEHLATILEYGVHKNFPDVVASQMQVWRSQFNRSFMAATSQQLAWIKADLTEYAGTSPSAADIAFYLS